MKAFKQGITKEQFLIELFKHRAADHFRQGKCHWSEMEKRGCAVGCSLRSIATLEKTPLNYTDHSLYEKYLGIPEWLALLEDFIFENISKERSKTWPIEFAQAINPGANLDNIKTDFICYILQENINTLESINIDNDNIKSVIQQSIDVNIQMIAAQRSGDIKQIGKVKSAAWSVDRDAWYIAEVVVVDSKVVADAAWCAADAARSVVNVPKYVFGAVSCAVEAASYAARFSVSVPKYITKCTTFKKHTNKLIELISQCKEECTI